MALLRVATHSVTCACCSYTAGVYYWAEPIRLTVPLRVHMYPDSERAQLLSSVAQANRIPGLLSCGSHSSPMLPVVTEPEACAVLQTHVC